MNNHYDNFQEEHFLPGKDKKYPYALPADYFNSLSSRLISKYEAEQELSAYKMLAELKKPLKLNLPENYFESLSGKLDHKYELSVYTQLSNVPQPVLKSLTEDYFDALEKKVFAKIELKDELEEFSLLSSIEKKNSFRVASAYFDDSTDIVKEKIHATAHRSGNIFEQIAAVLFKPKMAFALSFIVIMGFTSVWYYTKNNNEMLVPSGDCKTLACLEKNELLNEKNMNDFDDESLYEMVDVEMLDKKMADDKSATSDSITNNGSEN